MTHDNRISGFLADTWWFGLSQRLPEHSFRQLATLRAGQGFSAIQLVVGVPPEVGPENENARSQVGFPWTLNGDFNREYLDLARDRIHYLNKLGFVVVVYGAWGHQIEWLGREKMAQWWLHLLEALDDLNVIYCLCGESNLWVGEASKLLPDKSTDEFRPKRILLKLPSRIRGLFMEAGWHLKKKLLRSQFDKRRDDWSSVLEIISGKTNKPIIVHPIPGETGYEVVTNPQLLALNTVQTGHDASTSNRLWQLPIALLEENPEGGVINLEPWYEGINNQFGPEDQLFAYWVTMLAGATSYCYGAHGIWNVGDGKFLAHWGEQTFDQALAIETPRLLGLSHKLFLLESGGQGKTFYRTKGEGLITIGMKTEKRVVQFFPDLAKAQQIIEGRVWLPLKGTFAETLPPSGQAVIFREN